MKLRMWSYDLAREQCPTDEHLAILCRMSLEAGYNALGLYVEHRFAFPSAPWAHGTGALTPERVRSLQQEFPDLELIPFINLLGHMEGFIYTEEGAGFAESRFEGMQACPSNPHFYEFCTRLVDDTLAAFNSEVVHIGGDETWQLGQCLRCKDRIESAEKAGSADGKAVIYGEHFGRLAERVANAGRRPAVWGDMFFDHPTALELIPQNTIIFDWQYFHSAAKSSLLFRNADFETVFCPALHTYNASWLHLAQSEENIRENVAAAKAANAFGVCLTTWECALFGNYETLLPALRGAGKMIQSIPPEPTPPPSQYAKEPFPSSPQDIDRMRRLLGAPFLLKAYLEESELYEEWARLMGIELQECGGMFQFGGIRSALKCRLLLYSNPFLLWLRNREDLCGEPGDKALEVFNRALAVAPDVPTRGVAEFAQAAVQFVRYVEDAHQAYARGDSGGTIGALAPCRQIFDNLARIAKSTNARIGGSLADIERCRIAKEHVDRVIMRVKQYGTGSLGYNPSFEMLTHPKFVPHDQASWWLINRWANE